MSVKDARGILVDPRFLFGNSAYLLNISEINRTCVPTFVQSGNSKMGRYTLHVYSSLNIPPINRPEDSAVERFGKFELLEKSGEGGMATIFLAKPVDASFSKLVAVNRILPQLIDDPSIQE